MQNTMGPAFTAPPTASIAPIEGPRLTLRLWREADREPFRALNADPRVMAHFPSPLSADASDALMARIQKGFAENGFGLWALDIRPGLPECAGLSPDHGFAGFVGLSRPSFAPETIEIAWRLALPFQKKGFAAEAAALALEAGFTHFGLERIVAFTAVCNEPSRRLMVRLGMAYERTFAHPALQPEDRLSKHILYVMSCERWHVERRRFPFLPS